jgi:hypothetical protein
MSTNAKNRRANWSCPWDTGFLKYQFLWYTMAGKIRFAEWALRVWETRALAHVEPSDMCVFEVGAWSVIVFVGNCEPDPLVSLQLVFEFADKSQGIFCAEAVTLHLSAGDIFRERSRSLTYSLMALARIRVLCNTTLVSRAEDCFCIRGVADWISDFWTSNSKNRVM